MSKTDSTIVQADGRLTGDGEDGCYSLENRLKRGNEVSRFYWDGDRWKIWELSSIKLDINWGINFACVQSCLLEIDFVDG